MFFKGLLFFCAVFIVMFSWLAAGTMFRFVCNPAYAQDPLNLSLAAGREGGTYHAVGASMVPVLEKKDIHLSVMESEGSYQNVKDLTSGVVDLALAQMDVLAYFSNLAERNDADAKQILDSVQVLFPLFIEQVHIVVRDEMKFGTLRDFKGRRVEMGELNSGSYISTQVILHAMKLDQVANFLPKHAPPEAAFRAVKESRSDAMFYMAGAPAALFAKKFPGPATFKTKFVSLSLVDLKVLTPYYQTVIIPAGTYPEQTKAIQTVGTWAVLLSTSRVSKENGYALVKTLVESLPELKKSHKKWAEVKTDAVGKIMETKDLQPHAGLQQWMSENKTVSK